MGPAPFASRNQDLFPSHEGLDGNITREVPKAMVALIAMAVRLPSIFISLSNV